MKRIGLQISKKGGENQKNQRFRYTLPCYDRSGLGIKLFYFCISVSKMQTIINTLQTYIGFIIVLGSAKRLKILNLLAYDIRVTIGAA